MKIIYSITIFITFIILEGCRSNENEKEVYKIINDIFLDIADTTTYTYNTFLPSPNETISSYTQNSRFVIILNDSLEKIDDIKKELNLFGRKFQMSSKLLNSRSSLSHIDLTKIQEIGLFKLKKVNKNNIGGEEKIVGYLMFYKPIILKKEAIFAYKKSTSYKSGLVAILYLKNINNKWTIVQKEVVERW